MSETARKKVEADIVNQDNVQKVVVESGKALLQKYKAAVAHKAKTGTVNSNCDSHSKKTNDKSTAKTAKPRSAKKPLTTKQSGFSNADLEEFISLVNQDSPVEDTTNNELDQWKELLVKREAKPSRFKIDKNQLNSLLKKNESNALAQLLTSLKSPSTSFAFEGTPLGDVLKRNEADLSVVSKEHHDLKESQSGKDAPLFFENTEELSSLYVPFNKARSQIDINEGLLELSLGEKFAEYKSTVKRWLSGDIDRKSYSQQIRKILSKSDIERHNEYILSIIKTSLQRETEADFEHITSIYNIIDPSEEPTTSSDPAETTAKPIPKATKLPTPPAPPAPVTSKLASKSKGLKKKCEDDDDDFLVFTKSKKRRLILSDDDDSEEEPPKKTNKAEANNKTNHVIKRPSSRETEENDWSTLKRSKRKRKMVILSDEEGDDLNSLLNPRSSVSSVFDDRKTIINVKSSGLLKTTLTIKRNDDTNDSKASIIPKPISQPVSNTISKPIAESVSKAVAKPVSKPVAEPVSKSTSKPISKPNSKQLSKSVSKPVSKSIKTSKTSDSSSKSTKGAFKNVSKERISNISKLSVTFDESSQKSPVQQKYPSSLLDRLLNSDKDTSSQPSTSSLCQVSSAPVNEKVSSSVKIAENPEKNILSSTIPVENQPIVSKKTIAKKETPSLPLPPPNHQKRPKTSKSHKSSHGHHRRSRKHFKKPDNLLKHCLTKSIQKSQGKNGLAKVLSMHRKEQSKLGNSFPSLATTNHQVTAAKTSSSKSKSSPSGKSGSTSKLIVSLNVGAAAAAAEAAAAKSSPVLPPASTLPAATIAQKPLPPVLQRTSKIIELLNSKTVVSAGQNNGLLCSSSLAAAQPSSSQLPPTPTLTLQRQQSALEKLLTAPLNGFKEATTHSGQYYCSMANGTTEINNHHHHNHQQHHPHQKPNSALNAHNFSKETSEKAKMPCKIKGSELRINGENVYDAYQFNGLEDGKDCLNWRVIKVETEEEKEAAVEEVGTSRKANAGDNVIYQLDEFDDDEGVIQVPVTKDSRVLVKRDDRTTLVFPVKRLPSCKRINLVTTCFDQVCLPSNRQLSVRIVDVASRHEMQFAERGVVPFINHSLRNFMKNIIVRYSSARSAFSLTPSGVSHHHGLPILNPYIGNKYLFLGEHLACQRLKLAESVNFSYFRHSACQMRRPESLDAALRPKRYGIEKGELTFSHRDQAVFRDVGSDEQSSSTSDGSSSASSTAASMLTRYRPDSGCLRVYSSAAQEPPISAEGSLRHLLNVLQTERSLIPNHNIYMRTVFRTISAISNSEEDGMAAAPE